MDGGYPHAKPAPGAGASSDAGKPQPPETLVRERLDAESPDGRPPTRPVRRRSTMFFVLVLIAVAATVLISLYLGGGIVPAMVAVVLIAAFIGFAAWPAWHAAADRTHDRHVAEQEVRSDLGGAPPVGPGR
jgi:hypothetical protein